MTPTLKYTLCFCIHDQHVLLLKRKKKPNAGLWNGLGGKIEAGEHHQHCVIREIQEEAAIDLQRNCRLRYGGVVTWSQLDADSTSIGMHVYLAHLTLLPQLRSTQTAEGSLAWIPLRAVCEDTHPDLVSNIPIFLSEMCAQDDAHHFHFQYQDTEIMVVQKATLSS